MPENTEKGALTEAVYYILLSLNTPLHGYAIMQNITKITNGRVTLGAGTLYGAMNTLTDKKWIRSIESAVDSRKKEYVITDLGKLIVENELQRLKELILNGEIILGGVGANERSN